MSLLGGPESLERGQDSVSRSSVSRPQLRLQPGKFIAALQAASTSGKPVLLKVNYDDGHFTEEKTVTFRNFAAQFAFLLWQTGHREFQPAT